MKKIEQILFPTDFSEAAQHAFLHALVIANKADAAIQVLHVVRPQAEPMDIPIMASPATMEQASIARDLVEGFVTNGVADLEGILKPNLRIGTEVIVGRPAAKILKAIDQNEIDIVIMGAKGKHNLVETVMGSVASAIVKKAHCPVMIIPDSAGPLPKFQTIGYASNFNDADPYEIWKTINFLDHKESILRVVHINTEEENFVEKEELTDLRNFFKEHSPTLQIQFHQLQGGKKIENELVNFINIYDVDLMIMYQPKRGFIESIFHRSRTKRLAGKSNVPVLVMKE